VLPLFLQLPDSRQQPLPATDPSSWVRSSATATLVTAPRGHAFDDPDGHGHMADGNGLERHGAGASAQWVSRSLGAEFRAHRVRLAQVSGVGEIPTMRNVWVIYIIAILAIFLAAAWIILVQPHFHLPHG
jgi:hypothetical protein